MRDSVLQYEVQVYIEELVLYGFPPRNRAGIGTALESELARLCGEQGMPRWLAQNAEIPHLDGGVFEVKSGATPAAIGVQIAQMVYRGLIP